MSQAFITFARAHGVEIDPSRLDDSGKLRRCGTSQAIGNKASQAKYRESNREKLKAAGAAYREKNRLAILEKKKAAYSENKYGAKEYAAANREAILVAKRAYAAKNKALILERARRYYESNKEAINESAAQYHARNPEVARKSNMKRRALKAGSGGELSRDIVEVLLRRQRGLCINCRRKLREAGRHIDHIEPLSKGGLNCDSNVQLLCPPCNLKKHAKDPIDWAQENGRLL